MKEKLSGTSYYYIQIMQTFNKKNKVTWPSYILFIRWRTMVNLCVDVSQLKYNIYIGIIENFLKYFIENNYATN